MKLSAFSIILFTLLICFTSCSEADEVANNLEGSWNIAVYQKTVYQGTTLNLEESGTFENKGQIEFNSNGKGYYNVLEDLGAGTYYGSGEFTWTNTADEVSIISGFETKNFSIVESGKSTFELEREVSDFYFPGSEPGVSYSMIERLVLEK